VARSITLDSYSKATGVVTFTITGSTIPGLNQTYKLALPVDSKEACLSAIRAYLQAYIAGFQANVRPDAGTDVTAAMGLPQADTGA